MHVLITGGAGFIGSTLSERLLSLGVSVTAVDNFNPYYNPQYKRENIQSLLNAPGYTLAEGDIGDSGFLDHMLAKRKYAKVIHLAASVGVRNSLLHPEAYHRNNVVGTKILLEAAARHNVRHCIFASSSSIYGNDSPTPFAEDNVVDSPLNPYAQSKKDAEKFCESYHQKYGVPMTIFRFFTVYGPKGRPDMSPYIFTDAILNGKPIKVYGDGSARRDFTFVDDIVDGIIRGIQNPFQFEIFNLGSSTPIDVLSFIHIIETLGKKRAQIELAPIIPSEMKHTYANCQKANQLLGYHPNVNIETGMEKFIRWFQQFRLS